MPSVLVQLLLFGVTAVMVCQALRNTETKCRDGTEVRDLVAAGAFHTCMAKGAGGTVTETETSRRILCIGWQEFGQGVPEDGYEGMVTKLTSGARHSCGVDFLSLASCWGGNMYGQIEIPTPFLDQTPQRKPVLVPEYCRNGDYTLGDPSDRSFKRCVSVDKKLVITVEQPFAAPECLLPDGRQMVLKGFVRSSTEAHKPKRDKPAFRTDGKFNCQVHQIAAGGSHTCIIYGNEFCTNCNFGYTRCFGSNVFGQSKVPVCNMTDPEGDQPLPPEVNGEAMCSNGNVPATFSSIGVGLLHTCAVHTDGSLVCWGDNTWNQSSPPPGNNWKNVSCGAYHSCALDTGGLLSCWGNNTYGERAQHADLIKQSIITDGGKFLSVACGASHSCGLFLPSGSSETAILSNTDMGAMVVCWGADYAGQSSVPEAAQSLMLSVTVGWEHSCGVSLDDFKVICWGSTNWKSQKRSNDMEGAAVDVPHCTSVCNQCVGGDASRLWKSLGTSMAVASLVTWWTMAVATRL